MFDLRWLEFALDKLAEVYVETDLADQARIADGVKRLNAQLKSDPLAVGESRGGGYRVVFPPLIAVYYFVDEMNERVRVMDVIQYGR